MSGGDGELSHLQIVMLTIRRFRDIKAGDVEDYLLSMSCKDSPFTLVTFLESRHLGVTSSIGLRVEGGVLGGSKLGCGVLICPATCWALVQSHRLENVSLAEPHALPYLRHGSLVLGQISSWEDCIEISSLKQCTLRQTTKWKRSFLQLKQWNKLFALTLDKVLMSISSIMKTRRETERSHVPLRMYSLHNAWWSHSRILVPWSWPPQKSVCWSYTLVQPLHSLAWFQPNCL